jgi:hypothetical protein
MNNKIIISFDSESTSKLSVVSENLNILELDNSSETNKKIQEDLVIILYAYKKLIDVSEKRGIITEKSEIIENLDNILSIIG